MVVDAFDAVSPRLEQAPNLGHLSSATPTAAANCQRQIGYTVSADMYIRKKPIADACGTMATLANGKPATLPAFPADLKRPAAVVPFKIEALRVEVPVIYDPWNLVSLIAGFVCLSMRVRPCKNVTFFFFFEPDGCADQGGRLDCPARLLGDLFEWAKLGYGTASDLDDLCVRGVFLFIKRRADPPFASPDSPSWAS